MSGDPVTQGEFGRFVDTIAERFDRLEALVRDGFNAQNGRLRKLEATDATLIERIDTIQKRVRAMGARVYATGTEPSQRWWKPSKPLAQGGVGAGVIVGLIELGKAIVGAMK